jgi:hypothetical protein
MVNPCMYIEDVASGFDKGVLEAPESRTYKEMCRIERATDEK